MALVINTNMASITAQRNLNKTEGELKSSLARLSSGMRITAAKDDAAGLAISQKLKASIRGLHQANRNANDGISLVQTAEGALNEVSGILIRMRELAIQSSTGTLGSEERGYLDDEFQKLESEIDRIANVTEFAGTKLLDGSTSAGVAFQVGLTSSPDDSITVSIATTHASALGDTAFIDEQLLDTVTNSKTALGVIDSAINDISEVRGGLGAAQNRLEITVANLAIYTENLSAANSRILDVDVGSETVAMTRSQILMQAGVSILSQANQLPSMALSLLG